MVSKVRSQPVAENVHQFRTNSRRVQAILEEFGTEPTGKERKLLKSLSKLRKRAGQIRDLDVQIAALRDLKIGEAAEEKRELMGALNDERDHRAEQLVRALDDGMVSELRKRLKAAATAHESRRPHGNPLATALRMFSRLAKEASPAEENLHQYRIRCKKIRYIAELAGDKPEAQRVVEELKRLQDAIGEWHDWLTLTDAAVKMFPDRPNSALINALRSIARNKLREALRTVLETREKLLPLAQTQRRRRTAVHPESTTEAMGRKAVEPVRPRQEAATA